MIWTDIVIVLAVAAGAYAGAKRGLVPMALELSGFVAAWLAALASYRWLGEIIKGPLGVTSALANVAAFMLLVGLVELGVVLAIRFVVVPRLAHKVHFGLFSRLTGAVLGGGRTLLLVTVGLILFAGLPLSAAVKNQVTQALLAQPLLAASGQLQRVLDTSLGRDVNSTFTLLTAPAEPQDNHQVVLGFTITNGTVDQAAEERMLQLVNQERTSRGLSRVALNKGARSVARNYSRQMLADGLFSHIDKAGHSPFDRLRAGGVTFGLAGENLALAPTLLLAHQGLMDSPGHRANILRPAYRTVGIGIIDAGRYGLMVTQNFTD